MTWFTTPYHVLYDIRRIYLYTILKVIKAVQASLWNSQHFWLKRCSFLLWNYSESSDREKFCCHETPGISVQQFLAESRAFFQHTRGQFNGIKQLPIDWTNRYCVLQSVCPLNDHVEFSRQKQWSLKYKQTTFLQYSKFSNKGSLLIGKIRLFNTLSKQLENHV